MNFLFFANTDWYLYNFRLSLAIALKKNGHNVIFISPDGVYKNKLIKNGFTWIQAPMNRCSLNPFTELYLIFWLRRIILLYKIHIIHGFTLKNAIYSAIASKLSGNVPCVCAISGLGYVFSNSSFKAKFLKKLATTIMKFSFNSEKLIIILQNSDDVLLFKQEKIINENKIRLIMGSGVNCNSFSPIKHQSKGEPLRLILVARLILEKGILYYIDAARYFKLKKQPVQFYLAGDVDKGNPNSVPQDFIIKCEKEGLIKWLRHVENINSILSSMHAMVLPTFYGEGVPRSLIEAASCGMALITTDVPGCREIVEDNITGLLIKPKCSNSIINAINVINNNPDKAKKIGDAARKKAFLFFDEKIVIDKTIEVYEELIN